MTWRGIEVDDSKQSILPAAACYVQMFNVSKLDYEVEGRKFSNFYHYVMFLHFICKIKN